MKKLLFAAHNLDLGGIETALVMITNQLVKKGYNITIALEKKEGVFLKRLDRNIKIVEYNTSTSDNMILRKLQNLKNRIKFIDIMISQLKPNYMYNLNLYKKTIEQRNKYLRQIREENKTEKLLDIWDEKLVEYADQIYKYRKYYIEKIKEKIKKIHSDITEEKEEIEINYLTCCKNKEEYLNLLKEKRKIDIIKGYTTKGIHGDDFNIFINNKQLDIYGSQGQYRTAILSLKMSELEIIEDEIGEMPILLLDDFMSELDEKRRNHLLEKIRDIQVIITCTDKIKLENQKILIYNVNNGKVSREI